MRIVALNILFYSLLVLNFTSAQTIKKVIGVPLKFENVTDLEGPALNEFITSSIGKVNERRPWKVICDRDAEETYTSPGGSPSGKKLSFRSWYYVTEEKGEFIHLITIDGEPDSRDLSILPGSYIEDFGWIHKSRILLWTSGLRSPKSQIYLKSLILYTDEAADKIFRNERETVKVRSMPTKGGKSLDDISLYDYYFIFKKENGMYLLGKQNELSNSSLFKTEILGWVEQVDQADWNTRLALEHNFTKEGFDERANRPGLQFVCYSDQINAENKALTGSAAEKSQILDKFDPVNADKKILAKSDPKRFIGTILRMPVLFSGETYFHTGVLGTFGDTKANDRSANPRLQAAFDEISAVNKFYDVLFIIEATADIRQFRDEIVSSIEGLKRQLADDSKKRFAVAFYRDVKFNGSKPFLQITEFKDNISEIINTINNQNFISDDYDGYSGMMNAIYKSIARVGFQQNRTNIVYVIGKNPDFSNDLTLSLKCEERRCEEMISVDKLSTSLSDLRANIIFIQPNATDDLKGEEFRDQVENILLETSKKNFTNYKKINDLMEDKFRVENPRSKFDGNSIFITGGSTKCALYSSQNNQAMLKEDFMRHIQDPLRELKKNQDRDIELLSRLIDGGESFSDVQDEMAGANFNFASLQDKIGRILKLGNIDPTPENLKKLTERKVRLYIRAYVPKKIYGANHNLCSPVLFFPEKELGDYINELRNLTSLKDQPEDILRIRLKESLQTLFNKYAGNKKMPKDADLNKLREMLVGEGFKFENTTHNFVINKIDNPKVSLDQIRGFLDALESKYIKLENMTKDNKYEFKFKTRSGSVGSNNYYWIPFEDTF